MFRYLIGRLLGAIGVVWGVATLSFIMVFLMPGDPVRMYTGPRAPAAALRELREVSGTQLDAEAVDAFSAVFADPATPPAE